MAEDIVQELREQNAYLRGQVRILKGQQAAELEMVPLTVHLPQRIYRVINEQAEEQGRPASELASLWLWRAMVELEGKADLRGDRDDD